MLYVELGSFWLEVFIFGLVLVRFVVMGVVVRLEMLVSKELVVVGNVVIVGIILFEVNKRLLFDDV